MGYFISFLLSLGLWMFPQLRIPGPGGSAPASGGIFTLIQRPSNLACSGTTCAITLTQTTAANNLLVFQAYTADPVQISSVNKGGTLVTLPSCYTYDGNVGSMQCGWILPSGSSAATTPITVTFSASVGGFGGVRMYEFHPSANAANVGMDAVGAGQFASGATPTGPTFTWSGTGDAETQMCATQNDCTAVTSPYDANQDYNSVGWGAAPAPSNGTGPTWTLSGNGITLTLGTAFGFNTSACSDQTFANFEASTTGTAVTEALLRASTHGYNGGGWTVNGTAMTFQSAASQPLLNGTPRLCGDGVAYAAGAGTLGIRYVGTGGAALSYVQYAANVGPSQPSTSMLVAFWSDLASNDTSNYDAITIRGNGTDYINVKDKGNGAGTSRQFETEVGGGAAAQTYDHASSTWYWVYVQFNKTGTHIVKIFDASGSLLATLNPAAAGTDTPIRYMLGNDNGGAVTNGKVTHFDSMRISLTGAALTP